MSLLQHPDGRVLLVCHRWPGGQVDLAPVVRGPTDPDDAGATYRIRYPSGWRRERLPDGRRRPLVSMRPEAVAELPAFDPASTPGTLSLLGPRRTPEEARVLEAVRSAGPDRTAIERALWMERPRLSTAQVAELLARLAAAGAVVVDDAGVREA